MEGEEWSSWWGGSEAQWFGSIYPRVQKFLPARRILEIAPGYGRWTRYLLAVSESYVGIDLAAQAVDACKKRYAHVRRAEFIKNDGLSLDDAKNDSFDFIFSFDSLVHAEMAVMEKYIPQLVKKLTGPGVAFIHHSNFLQMKPGTANPHSRAASISAQNVSELVSNSGGKILVQEIINWGGPDLIDCFTLFGRSHAFSEWTTVSILNPRWTDEMTVIREAQSPYSTVAGTNGGWGALGAFRRSTTWQLPLAAKNVVERFRKGLASVRR